MFLPEQAHYQDCRPEVQRSSSRLRKYTTNKPQIRYQEEDEGASQGDETPEYRQPTSALKAVLAHHAACSFRRQLSC
jgi:hypothetical protein